MSYLADTPQMAMGHNLWRAILGRNTHVPPILTITRGFPGFRHPQPNGRIFRCALSAAPSRVVGIAKAPSWLAFVGLALYQHFGLMYQPSFMRLGPMYCRKPVCELVFFFFLGLWQFSELLVYGLPAFSRTFKLCLQDSSSKWKEIRLFQ